MGHGEELFCLLEDDALISRITIEARRLNTTRQDDEDNDYAELDVNATFKVLHLTPHAELTSAYVGR